MTPSLIAELLLTVLPDSVYEAQSLDECPERQGYFAVVSMEESTITNPAISKGPRTVTVAVHRNAETDRDYTYINSLLNYVDGLLLSIENLKGSDGVRVSQVRRLGRSGNLLDEGWNTITRTATYGVLYDEYSA